MSTPHKWLLALVALGLGSVARAQEPAPEPEEPPTIPMPIPPASQDQTAKELMELFQKVDQSLARIDNMLFDMGAGERPLEAPEDSGLGALLDLARESSQGVIEGIDRILELADKLASEQRSSSSSSSSGGQPKGQQSSGQQSEQQQKEEGQKDPEGQKPDGSKHEGEDPAGKEPKSSEESKEDPNNTTEGQDGSHPTGAGSRADATERWGELPERVRETFRNQGGEEAPLYYRDWIDSYYRHLSRNDG